MSNVIAQALLAKRMGQKSVITATSAGNHGVAAAAVCAKYSLDCTIFIGTRDIQRNPSSVQRMKLLGAQVLLSASLVKLSTHSPKVILYSIELKKLCFQTIV